MSTIMQILMKQLDDAHETLEGTMADVTQEMMDWQPPGKANSIGSTYAHLVLSEDMIVNGILSNLQPLMKTTYANNAGVDQFMPNPNANWEQSYRQWTQTVKTTMPKLKKYAQAVYTRTKEVLNSINDNQLADELDLSNMNLGKKTREHVISEYLTGHTHNISGEISAIKGVQGHKGYPF